MRVMALPGRPKNLNIIPRIPHFLEEKIFQPMLQLI